MKKSHNSSLDFELLAKLPDINRQHLHIPKNYTNTSPFRNKQNILKTLKKQSAQTSETKARISPSLSRVYQKILEKSSQEKENCQIRSLSVKRQMLLNDIWSKPTDYSEEDQKEIIKDYKVVHEKFNSIMKNKLPASLRKFK
jgi:N-acetylmuramoyl-L-alanine amidase CwlA